MLLNKKIIKHTNSIGEFTYTNGYWYSEDNHLSNEISLCLGGESSEPNVTSVENLQQLLTILPQKISLAKEYISSIDNPIFSKIELEEITSDSELGSYHLEFGSTIDNEFSIVVHFKYGKPNEFSVNH